MNNCAWGQIALQEKKLLFYLLLKLLLCIIITINK